MASSEQAICSILLNNTEVAALVGTRIFPNSIPQSATLPLIEYSDISTIREKSMSGSAGLSQSRIQVNAVAKTYSDAKTLADAIRNALEFYIGTVASTKIQGIFSIDDSDTPHLAISEEQTEFAVRNDYYIWFEN